MDAPDAGPSAAPSRTDAGPGVGLGLGAVERPAASGSAFLREANDRAAITLLLESGPLSRVRLSALAEVSRPTASQIVTRLERAGLIGVVGRRSGGRGPVALTYDVRLDEWLAVAVEVGIDDLRVTVVDLRGGIRLPAPLVVPRDTTNGPDVRPALDVAVARAVEAAGAAREHVRAATVSVQGAVDPRSGGLRHLAVDEMWPRGDVRAALERTLGMPVAVENDVNLAAVADRRQAGGAAASSVYLWLGQGVGTGVHVAGELVRGQTGSAGELGYLGVPHEAHALEPGAEELQELIGGSAWVALAARHGLEAESFTALCGLLADAPRGAVPAAFLDDVARRVWLSLRPAVLLLDPDELVLGGPLASALGEDLRSRVQDQTRPTGGWTPAVRTSAVVDDAVLRGAAVLAADQVREQLLGAV